MIDLIIPVYNVKPYIRKCIDSALAQTLNCYRIILVDDGSTDGSGEICDEYAKQCGRIEVIHQKNMGLSGAKNTGLKISKAPYIMFLDSDDWISSNTLEMMMGVIESEPFDIVQCKAKIEYNDLATETHVAKCAAKVKTYNCEGALKSFFSDGDIGPASWGKLYKREILHGIIFPVGKVHEDVAVITDILDRCDKIAFIDKELWHYRYRVGSISRTHYAQKNRFLFDCVEKMSVVLKKYPKLQSSYEGYKLLMVKSLFLMFSEDDKVDFSSDYNEYLSLLKNNRRKVLLNNTIKISNKFSILLASSKWHNIIKNIFRRIRK